MPRRIAADDEMPRPRRAADAIARDVDVERGLAMRLLLRSPKDLVAGTLAFAAIGAIVANALFLQVGPHPSPMFGSVVAIPATAPPSNLLPRPRPPEAAVRPAESAPAEPKPVSPKALDLKGSEMKAADPLTNLVKATSTPAAAPTVLRPPAPIPVSSHGEGGLNPGGSRRVAAVQRALTEYGYGQLKPTGTVGSDTQAAIQRFEHERKIPAAGQVSDRLVRELSAMIGHPID